MKFHDLRHTQATHLIALGEDIKTVQQRLGHRQAATTLDLYAGFIPAKDEDAAAAIGGLLQRAQEKAGNGADVVNF